MASTCTVSYVCYPSLAGDGQKSIDTFTADTCDFFCVTYLPPLDGSHVLTQSVLDTIVQDLRDAAETRLAEKFESADERVISGRTRYDALKLIWASGEEEVKKLNKKPAYKDSVFFAVDLVEMKTSLEKAEETANLLSEGRYPSEEEQRKRVETVASDRS